MKAITNAITRVQKKKECSREDASDFIYAQVAKFAESPAGQKNGFTPHCATWMNGDRFFDDPTEWWKDCATNGTNGEAVVKVPTGNALDYQRELLKGGVQ
jgi:hypothetical protein